LEATGKEYVLYVIKKCHEERSDYADTQWMSNDEQTAKNLIACKGDKSIRLLRSGRIKLEEGVSLDEVINPSKGDTGKVS